jgi:XRE family transcriptional regulator, regulator of sulfur utilization
MAARPRSARLSSAAAQVLPAHPKRPTVEGLGDDVGAAELARRVAEHVKRLRAERQLSLDQLAQASGVSRAALSQIEGARTNPTLGIVWKVAVGLGVPFQALVGAPEASQTRLLRAGDAVALRSTDGQMESRLLSAFGSADRIEVYELRIQTKGLHRSEPHGPGTQEAVILLTGALRVTAGDDKHDLGAGDTLFFSANLPHSYENRSTRESRCIDIIAYGKM